MEHFHGTFMAFLWLYRKDQFVDSPKYPKMTLGWITYDRSVIYGWIYSPCCFTPVWVFFFWLIQKMFMLLFLIKWKWWDEQSHAPKKTFFLYLFFFYQVFWSHMTALSDEEMSMRFQSSNNNLYLNTKQSYGFISHIDYFHGTFMVFCYFWSVSLYGKDQFVDSPKYSTLTLEWINDNRSVFFLVNYTLKETVQQIMNIQASSTHPHLGWNLIVLWEKQTTINSNSHYSLKCNEIWDLQLKARLKLQSVPPKKLLYDFRRNET